MMMGRMLVPVIVPAQIDGPSAGFVWLPKTHSGLFLVLTKNICPQYAFLASRNTLGSLLGSSQPKSRKGGLRGYLTILGYIDMTRRRMKNIGAVALGPTASKATTINAVPETQSVGAPFLFRLGGRVAA